MDTKFICDHCRREVNGYEDRLDGHLILEQNYHCPYCGYGYEFSYGAERIYPSTHSFSGIVLLIAHSLHIDRLVEWLEYKLTKILRRRKYKR